MYKPLLLLIFLVTLNFSGKNPRPESLINVRKINQDCIVVNFGADAVTAINTSDGIVIIDAGISSELASLYREIIEKEFGKSNFIYLIYTHSHSDHSGGSSVFDDAEVIGHSNCSSEIERQAENHDALLKNLEKIKGDYEKQLDTLLPASEEWNYTFTQKTRYSSAFQDAENNVDVLQPSITFANSLSIYPGNLEIQMFYFGSFHSESDILIYIPRMQLLFTGDIFSENFYLSRDNSFLPDNHQILRSVKWLNERSGNIKTVVTGHGAVIKTEAYMFSCK